MNQILIDFIAFLRAGRRFERVRPDCRVRTTDVGPRRVTFHFANGDWEERVYSVDHATFMTWWRQVSTWRHQHPEAFEAHA